MQHRLLIISLGLAALLAPAGASAKEVEGWEVERFDTGDGCIASRIVGGVDVSFHYNTSGGRFSEFLVVVVSPNWDALVTNGEQQGTAEVRLTKSAGSYTLSTEGRALKLSDGYEAVVASYTGGTATEARHELGEASMMTVSFKGNEIGTFALQGTSSALNALFFCGSGFDKF